MARRHQLTPRGDFGRERGRLRKRASQGAPRGRAMDLKSASQSPPCTRKKRDTRASRRQRATQRVSARASLCVYMRARKYVRVRGSHACEKASFCAHLIANVCVRVRMHARVITSKCAKEVHQQDET
eukprot:2163149-Pleurochrysis_carterae.AAC.1